MTKLLKVISVQDVKAQAFLNPAIVRTSAEAIRLFEAQTKDTKSQFHQFPNDFVLHELGEWDELSGTIIPYTKSTVLAVASDFLS